MRRLLFLFCLFIGTTAFSQSVLDLKLDGSEKGKRLDLYLQELEKTHPVRFYFIEDWISNLAVKDGSAGMTLREVLYDLFLGSDINYIEVNPNTIVLVKDPAQALQRNTIINAAVRSQKKIEKMVFGTKANTNPRQKVTFSGIITDSKSRDPLVGASVVASDIQVGGVTNVEGKFELRLPVGSHVINFNYVNFEERVIDLEIYADGSVKIEMEETPTVLDEVVIQDRSAREITTSGIGQTQISMKEVKRAPALLGEVDLIKQIQVLPGVTTVGEAASGFNVRGGGVDQNLILYDGLPVFNSSHVFGFFSSFNSEAIRDVTFYRGGIPAEFGGRVSSVLDIRSKEGSYEKWGASGGIGMISSNLMVNGPIVKDKTSIAVSARTTYSDYLINTIKSNYVNLNKSSVSFYDATAKVTHLFSERTKLTASGYISHDQFRLAGDSTYSWDSKMASVRLDHEFSKSFSGSLMAGYGSYGYEVSDKDPLAGFNLNYKINYPSAKLDFHINREKHKIGFGAQSTYYDFNPGTFSPSSAESNKKFVQMDVQKSLESGLFIADQFDLFKRMHIDAGLRFSVFNSLGPANVNIYAPGGPRETLSLIDTVRYGSGQTVKSFYNWEPRLGLRYELSQDASIKLGYNRVFQYLHLVTNTTAVTPVDIWQPSGPYFKPQMADQVSLGYFRNFKDRKYETFIEGYYKIIENVLDFKDGASLILNPQIETALLQGKARAYGAEFQISKTQGRMVGSISYAYSRSLRTIQGLYPTETINNGKEYASNYDQPHVVNLNWKYNITRRFFFTGGFTYRTGRPITLPLSAFTVDNFTVSSFSDRNQFRIPDYHRLDLALVIEGNHKRKKFWDGTWTISIYNVYGRKNPYTIFFKEVRPGILRPYRLAIIGTALPSISYSFKI
ncbi:MAG: carboxypeptidase-like regulatory domain-containing protein [Cyclobacteriaceae bacterium]